MLSEEQRSNFITVYADATRLALDRRITVAYIILDRGLDQAEQASRRGEFSAQEAIGLYRQALREFVERYGYPEQWPPQPEPRGDLSLSAMNGAGPVQIISEKRSPGAVILLPPRKLVVVDRKRKGAAANSTASRTEAGRMSRSLSIRGGFRTAALRG